MASNDNAGNSGESSFKQDLSKEEPGDLHGQLLKETVDLLKMSRSKMSKRYRDWDLYEEVYRAERQIDSDDVKARERKEPTKMVVPMTLAQVQSFVGYAFQLLTQRNSFFELAGMGIEDWKPAKLGEAFLDRDLDYNQWAVKLYQFLLNVGKFGLGVLGHSWARIAQQQLVQVQTPQAPGLNGVQMNFSAPSFEYQDVVSFLGNMIENISPYRWFPDPRVPISRFQDGEFCASERDVTHTWLKKMEKNGMFQGTKWVKDMPTAMWEWRSDHGLRSDVEYDKTTSKQKGGVILTNVEREIIPADYKLPNGSPMGEEDFPIKYIIVVANDSRIIKAEPLNYKHDHYKYSAAQLTPDDQRHINAGIAEWVNELQSVISWFINSRITSVRKVIQDRLVVDTEGVEMDDFVNRRSVIRLKKGARGGVDRYIKQLQINDVTQSNIPDSQALGQIMQLVTSINDNAQGQYSSGRRSATQTQAANAGAGSRLKMYVSLIWAQAFKPLGADMLSNLRDGLDEPQIVKLIGQQVQQPLSPYAVGPYDTNNFLSQSVSATKADLIGNYDFKVLEGTLPSEKLEIADQLQQLLEALISNPQAAMILGLDAKSLLQEIAELRNIRNPEKFNLQAAQYMQMMQASQQANASGNPQLGQQLALPAASAASTQATAGQPQSPIEALSASLPTAQLG